jgi:hypothetical protein
MSSQSIHQPEEDLVVRIDFDPHDALCVETVARNVTQFQPGDEVFGNIAGAGWGGFSGTVFSSPLLKTLAFFGFWMCLFYN